jgi:hypothetical protein
MSLNYGLHLHVTINAIGLIASDIVILIRLNCAELLIILLIRRVFEKKDDKITEAPSTNRQILLVQAAVIPCIFVLNKSNVKGTIDNEMNIVPKQIKYLQLIQLHVSLYFTVIEGKVKAFVLEKKTKNKR